MIREGRVTVNGAVVDELGTRADSENDHIKVDGKLLHEAEPLRYILLYKPREVMTTTSDPEKRTTVMDFLKGIRERLFPVGRLDYHSEGLLLLTNDGDLAFRVSHPSQGSVKTYHVKVRGVPPQGLIEKLEQGIVLDGKRTLPCEIRGLRTTGRGEDAGNSWWEVRLREGRTNQIRKMFQVKGHPVSKLRRVAIGALSDTKLEPGEWRELSPREIRMLSGDKTDRAVKTPKVRGRVRAADGTSQPLRKKSSASKKKAGTTRAGAAGRPSASKSSSAGSGAGRAGSKPGRTASKSGRAATGKKTGRTTGSRAGSAKPAGTRRSTSRPAERSGGRKGSGPRR